MMDSTIQSSMTPNEMQKFLACALLLCKSPRQHPRLSASCRVYELNDAATGALHNDTVSGKAQSSLWRSCADENVSVHVFFDKKRKTYRIISVQGTQALINLTLTPSTTVKRLSSKFLQLIDNQIAAVFGLGFNDEAQLLAFSDGVREIQTQLSTQNGFQDDSDDAPHPKSNYSIEQAAALRLENERLKCALAESSMNARQWEHQMSELHKENEQLNKAIEQSKSPCCSRKDAGTQLDKLARSLEDLDLVGDNSAFDSEQFHILSTTGSDTEQDTLSEQQTSFPSDVTLNVMEDLSELHKEMGEKLADMNLIHGQINETIKRASKQSSNR